MVPPKICGNKLKAAKEEGNFELCHGETHAAGTEANQNPHSVSIYQPVQLQNKFDLLKGCKATHLSKTCR
jgi:hypothetical protein